MTKIQLHYTVFESCMFVEFCVAIVCDFSIVTRTVSRRRTLPD